MTAIHYDDRRCLCGRVSPFKIEAQLMIYSTRIQFQLLQKPVWRMTSYHMKVIHRSISLALIESRLMKKGLWLCFMCSSLNAIWALKMNKKVTILRVKRTWSFTHQWAAPLRLMETLRSVIKGTLCDRFISYANVACVWFILIQHSTLAVCTREAVQV